jgi:hypothetical protein
MMMTGVKQIDAKTLYVAQTQQLPALPPDRPEPSQEEREAARLADRWPMGKMLKELKWTAADLDEAYSFGFPKSIGRALKGWGVSGNLEPIYSHKQVDAFWARFHAFAAKAPKK